MYRNKGRLLLRRGAFVLALHGLISVRKRVAVDLTCLCAENRFDFPFFYVTFIATWRSGYKWNEVPFEKVILPWLF
jgi:hypothetical protein